MSLVEVQKLATELGMNYQMARRSPGAKLIVPSVINWRVGHYAAITEQRNGKFLAQDPTFGDQAFISRQAIDQGQSGYYLIFSCGRTPGRVATGEPGGREKRLGQRECGVEF